MHRPNSRITCFLLLASTLAVGTTLAVTASPAAATPVGWDARGGWYTESDAFFLGGGARIGLGAITFNPTAEYLFVDQGSSYSLNLDGTMTVLPLGVGSGWLGGGVGFYTTKPDHGRSSTDTGFNLLAGVGLNSIPLKPYAQFKYVVMDGSDPACFAFGVRF
jgi:hypothetical protein